MAATEDAAKEDKDACILVDTDCAVVLGEELGTPLSFLDGNVIQQLSFILNKGILIVPSATISKSMSIAYAAPSKALVASLPGNLCIGLTRQHECASTRFLDGTDICCILHDASGLRIDGLLRYGRYCASKAVC